MGVATTAACQGEPSVHQTVEAQDLVQFIWDELMRLVGEKLQVFATALEDWINTRLQKPLPADWREQLAQFLAVWDAKGYEVLPVHVRGLEDWIEAWARLRGVLPATATVKTSTDCAIARPAACDERREPVGSQVRPSAPAVSEARRARRLKPTKRAVDTAEFHE